MKVATLISLTVLFAATINSAIADFKSGIADIEAFKKEIAEPYKSWLVYGVSGIRGLRDGYLAEYHHHQASSAERKEDAKCFSESAENELYQVVYFFF